MDALNTFDGKHSAIMSFGTHNPQVAAFVQASFQLEGLGGLSQVTSVGAAPAISGLPQDRGISLG